MSFSWRQVALWLYARTLIQMQPMTYSMRLTGAADTDANDRRACPRSANTHGGRGTVVHIARVKNVVTTLSWPVRASLTSVFLDGIACEAIAQRLK